MEQFIQILRLIAVLFAAYLLGNWFLAETRRKRAQGASGFHVYLTLPGIIIIVAAIALPVIMWILQN